MTKINFIKQSAIALIIITIVMYMLAGRANTGSTEAPIDTGCDPIIFNIISGAIDVNSFYVDTVDWELDLTCIAGPDLSFYFDKADPSFENLLDALEFVESKGDPWAVCPYGCCVGAYQLTEIYVDDCNRILELYGDEKRVIYSDRWSKEDSRKITAVVTCYYANHDWQDSPHTKPEFFETAARTHKSPSHRNHESTKAYWLKVKAVLESSNGN